MLANASTLASKFADTSNPSAVRVMRQASKNIIYSIVNGNAVNGLTNAATVTYKTAPWRMALYAADALLALLAAVCVALGVYIAKKPETPPLTEAEKKAKEKAREAVMKKMSVVLTALLVILIIVTIATRTGGGGASAPAEAYNAHTAFVEAGYEGDCLNALNTTLILNADGSYTLLTDMCVNQISGIIVFSNSTYYTGTYEVISEADGVKTVQLSDAVSAVSNAAGIVTTSAADASLLEGCKAQSAICNATDNSLTLGG